MVNFRIRGSFVFVCLAFIWRSNEDFGKVLAMGIAHRVRDCPRDETEWQKASNRLNCISDVRSTKNKYHCLPADNLTTLLEFCYNRTRTQVVEGQCMVLVERKHIVNNYDCSMFKEGCPNTRYFSDQMYKFPACFEIDPLLHCYKAEASCQPTTRSVTVMSETTQSTLVNTTSYATTPDTSEGTRSVTVLSDTTQSTLVNKTSNATTQDTHDRKNNPLVIILSVCGGFVLVIIVAVFIVAWKKCGRRKRCFGRIEINQPEGDGEELRLLRTRVNEDIERLGIDYLRHSLPRDLRTYPMIAAILKIPQEILYWSLENREKFIRSMNVGNISVFNGRAMVIGCARAGKTTLVKKIKGDEDLTTTSTSGIEIHSHTFKLNSDESTIIVSSDEDKEKGCLCLAPGMLDMLEENTQNTSVSVNVNGVPDQSNVTSQGEENHVVDIASSLPSSTEGTLNSNNDEVVDDTDRDVNESNQPINNSTAAAGVTPDTERAYATLEQDVDLNDCVPSVNMDNLKMLSLLDFAGHSAYYACHHIFFSPRAFFILVVDMTKDLNSIPTEACRKEGLIYSNWTYADYIKYWLGSIRTYSSKEAPVILAFSHSEDNGADPEKALQYFRRICECLPRKLLDHLDKRRIFSFQKLSDKNVEAFKECLATTVKSQRHWGERVPISWTKLESVLRKFKERNNVLSFSNLLRNVLETNDLKINNAEDLINALIFFNDTGVILFRSEIKDIIILDVQWLVDAFKRIIFDEEHMEAMEGMSDFAEFQELTEHGLLTSNALNVLWQNSDFYQHKESLVNHMKHLDMLAELSEELWYVPCMNKQKFDSTILDNCNVSSRLCFLFEFLPFVIYHRLVVACINNMGMKPRLNTKSKCIFHTVTILGYKDDTHRVLIALCDNKESLHREFPFSIEIQINVTKPREIDTRITSIIKELVCQNLNVLTQGHSSCEIYSQIGYRCRLEQFGKDIESHIIKDEEMRASEYDCPKCNQSHIVDVQSIRRFWEGKADPTDFNSEKEERDIESRYPPLVLKSTIKVPGMYYIRHISVVSPDKLWVSDEDTLKQLDGTGHVIRTLDGKYENWDVGGGHTVSVEGDLVFIAGDRNMIPSTSYDWPRRQYGIHKMTADGSITTLLTLDLTNLSPGCIHSSHINGDLLIGLFDNSYPPTGRVMRCDGTGRKIRDIELDEEGQGMYKRPLYITENKMNGDIVVSDLKKNALVVVDRSGRHRFDYTGHSTDKSFNPGGVCTNLLGRILVFHRDNDTKCISLLDHDGQFLTRLLTEPTDRSVIIFQRSLCVDDKNNIYVAYQNKIKVFR
ncbi:uncharacterized protein LOC111112647 [Crassostrea virginica]